LVLDSDGSLHYEYVLHGFLGGFALVSCINNLAGVYKDSEIYHSLEKMQKANLTEAL
jgi:hypothetical protein